MVGNKPVNSTEFGFWTCVDYPSAFVYCWFLQKLNSETSENIQKAQNIKLTQHEEQLHTVL